MRMIRENAENITLRTVNKIDATLAAVEKIPQNLALALESGNLNKQQTRGSPAYDRCR